MPISKGEKAMENEECSNLEAWLRIAFLILMLGWVLPWACEEGRQNRLDDESVAEMHRDNQAHRDSLRR